jgi:hypothetical protein
MGVLYVTRSSEKDGTDSFPFRTKEQGWWKWQDLTPMRQISGVPDLKASHFP